MSIAELPDPEPRVVLPPVGARTFRTADEILREQQAPPAPTRDSVRLHVVEVTKPPLLPIPIDSAADNTVGGPGVARTVTVEPRVTTTTQSRRRPRRVRHASPPLRRHGPNAVADVLVLALAAAGWLVLATAPPNIADRALCAQYFNGSAGARTSPGSLTALNARSDQRVLASLDEELSPELEAAATTVKRLADEFLDGVDAGARKPEQTRSIERQRAFALGQFQSICASSVST